MTDTDRIYRDLRIGKLYDVLWYILLGALIGSGIWEGVKVVVTGRIL